MQNRPPPPPPSGRQQTPTAAQLTRSPNGIIDPLSIAPTRLALLFLAPHALIDLCVRMLRLLREFRVLTLTGDADGCAAPLQPCGPG